MIDLYTEFKAVLQALNAAQVPYALCGGLALMVYQRPRATVDIDLVVPAETTDACIQAVSPLGFRAHPRPMRIAASGIEVLRFYKVDPGGADVLTLYCLLTTHPTVTEAWRTRMQVAFEEASVWVVSIEGLVGLKQLRGSAQDLLDIEALKTLRNSQGEIPPGGHDA
ncbi:MAG: nucleotidyl transferase AbiEii/AbiGii toxin family protein [Candidatus Methylomirabilota bacterium]